MRFQLFKRFVLSLVALSSLAIATSAKAQGLSFASEERLRGIPLASTPFSGAELPGHVDLSNLMPPVGNQGQQNSCVAWTVAYALKSYQERVEAKTAYHFDAEGHVSSEEVFSPSYIYNQINNGRDNGSEFADALNVLSSQGVACWKEMPYNDHDFTTAPSSTVRAHAKINRIDTWRRVNVADTNEIKAHLAAGFPVMIGARLDEGFMSAGPGFIWHEVTGAKKGGHAMLVVGYDDSKQAFKLLNSWGSGWGDHGYGWVDYGFFREVVREAYVAKAAHRIVQPQPEPQPTIDPNQPQNPVIVQKPEPSPVDPAELLKLVNFRWGNMVHNIAMVDHPEAGPCLGLRGQVDVPPGIGNNMQIVMYFFYDNGMGGIGKPVHGTIREFATVQGAAADGTSIIPIGVNGIGQMGLTSVVPYAALDLPAGGPMYGPDGNIYYQPRTTALVAVPVLFIDGFGVKTGPLQHFLVMR